MTLFAVLLILDSPLQAQHPIRPQAGFIRLRNGLVKVQRNIADASLKRDSLGAAHFNRHYYVMAQFDLLPDSIHKVQMSGSGLRLFDYLADRCDKVKDATGSAFDDLKKAFD